MDVGQGSHRHICPPVTIPCGAAGKKQKQKAQDKLFWELSEKEPSSTFSLSKDAQRVYIDSSGYRGAFVSIQ